MLAVPGLWLNSDEPNKWRDWARLLTSDHLTEDVDDYGVDHHGRLVHRSWLYIDGPAVDLQIERLPLFADVA